MTFKTTHQAADDRYIDVYTAAIAKSGTRSGGVFLDGRAPVRLIPSAGWSSTATIVHVDLSEDGTTYVPLWSASTAYTVPTVASRASRVDPEIFGGVSYIRLVGTTARGTAEAQSTGATVSIVARLL